MLAMLASMLLPGIAAFRHISADGVIMESLEDNLTATAHNSSENASAPNSFRTHQAFLEHAFDSMEYCFKKRGLWDQCLKQSSFTAMMHSGTAVYFHGFGSGEPSCRREVNDIDLWVPQLRTCINDHGKISLRKAYPERRPGYDVVGKTDKGKFEHDEQIYCPEERGFKEVDAYFGAGGFYDTLDSTKVDFPIQLVTTAFRYAKGSSQGLTRYDGPRETTAWSLVPMPPDFLQVLKKHLQGTRQQLGKVEPQKEEQDRNDLQCLDEEYRIDWNSIKDEARLLALMGTATHSHNQVAEDLAAMLKK